MSSRTIARLVPATASGSLDPAASARGARSAAPSRPAQLMELWHPWASRHWPCTATEEAAFVADLETLAAASTGDERPHDRRDVTAVVTALRSGLTVEELLSNARGLRPARLLAAYRALDEARRAAVQAWSAIVATPTSAALRRFGDTAATMLPVIVSHLEAIDHRSPQELERAVRAADAEIVRTTQSVTMLEERLDECVAPSERGRAVGALLFDGRGEGAWSMGTFLPPRVGTLVPLRVAALLGEEQPGRLRRAS